MLSHQQNAGLQRIYCNDDRDTESRRATCFLWHDTPSPGGSLCERVREVQDSYSEGQFHAVQTHGPNGSHIRSNQNWRCCRHAVHLVSQPIMLRMEARCMGCWAPLLLSTTAAIMPWRMPAWVHTHYSQGRLGWASAVLPQMLQNAHLGAAPGSLQSGPERVPMPCHSCSQL